MKVNIKIATTEFKLTNGLGVAENFPMLLPLPPSFEVQGVMKRGKFLGGRGKGISRTSADMNVCFQARGIKRKDFDVTEAGNRSVTLIERSVAAHCGKASARKPVQVNAFT